MIRLLYCPSLLKKKSWQWKYASRLGYSFFTLFFLKKFLDYVLNLNTCYRFFTKINMPLIHDSDFRCVFHTFHKVRIVCSEVFFPMNILCTSSAGFKAKALLFMLQYSLVSACRSVSRQMQLIALVNLQFTFKIHVHFHLLFFPDMFETVTHYVLFVIYS